MVVVIVGLVIEISRCIPRDTNELSGGLTFSTMMKEQGPDILYQVKRLKLRKKIYKTMVFRYL